MDIPDQLEFISAVMTASIAHDVNQPLAAAMTGAEACLRWLDRETPDIAKARSSVELVINDICRARDVIRPVRSQEH